MERTSTRSPAVGSPKSAEFSSAEVASIIMSDGADIDGATVSITDTICVALAEFP